MTQSSVKMRFVTTFMANVVRGGVSFLTGTVIARGLGPKEFGDYSFLLGSFTAIVSLLDMGTSAAFYTFISQKNRGRYFVQVYLVWEVLILLVTLLLVAVIIPDRWAQAIWIGQEKTNLILALFAIYMQQQIWVAIAQLGESKRLTFQVQFINITLVLTQLLLVSAAWHFGFLSIKFVYTALMSECIVAAFCGYHIFFKGEPASDRKDWQLGALFREYRVYCAPLIVYSGLNFVYTFTDNWLLRNYGGAHEQAYYQIGSQFAMVSLFCTISMVRIFWKEIAEAHESNNPKRVFQLFQKVSRGLYFASAVISGFLIPWASEIIQVLLGPAYLQGALVLAVMFIYPVHQSLGQIAGTMFYATAKTKVQASIGIAFMVISIPISYILQAPQDAVIPGFGMGSLGMSLKMVIMNIIGVNISLYCIARINHWKFDWVYQVVSLSGTVTLGYMVKGAVNAIGVYLLPTLVLPIQFVLALLCYLLFTVIFLFSIPSLAGLSRAELKNYLHLWH